LYDIAYCHSPKGDNAATSAEFTLSIGAVVYFCNDLLTGA